MNGSASPKAAIGPVRGLTWPILMTRDWALAGSTRSTAGAATAPRPAAMMRRRLIVPVRLISTSRSARWTCSTGSYHRGRRASPGGDRGFDIGRIDLPGEAALQLVAVELALPPGHHDAGDAVAGDVGEGPAFAHEFV